MEELCCIHSAGNFSIYLTGNKWVLRSGCVRLPCALMTYIPLISVHFQPTMDNMVCSVYKDTTTVQISNVTERFLSVVPKVISLPEI